MGTSTMSMDKILIIDDDEGLTHFLSRFFSRKGYSVTACKDGLNALDVIAGEQFDLILMDYKMPELNGLETLKRIKDLQVKTPVIIMTAYGTTETAIEAMKRGAYDYLLKPFDRKELSRIIYDALAINRQMKEVVSFPQPPGKAAGGRGKGALCIIGGSKRMQDVYKLIGQVAEKDVSVLIGGESGTGKELVARAIYHHSLRKDSPFMAVNCAAIPDALFESELFGYERGAFTGAERTHMGKLERCDGGTFFLDEIGDMSLSTQSKLLRVLQEGEFERLGGLETIKVNIRIIAATN
ncbi:MAG: sigma-54 dependent transcriptional regulator, partial [Desulfatibacillaceae bacterium]|nr:sigma-54 dependent transcriptional regulator [Desulfatibacillaceae bacterium]